MFSFPEGFKCLSADLFSTFYFVSFLNVERDKTWNGYIHIQILSVTINPIERSRLEENGALGSHNSGLKGNWTSNVLQM